MLKEYRGWIILLDTDSKGKNKGRYSVYLQKDYNTDEEFERTKGIENCFDVGSGTLVGRLYQNCENNRIAQVVGQKVTDVDTEEEAEQWAVGAIDKIEELLAGD